MDWKVIALRNVAFRKNLEIFGAYVSEPPAGSPRASLFQGSTKIKSQSGENQVRIEIILDAMYTSTTILKSILNLRS
jgi:hypothetical protein